ncbi:hypothetical protein ACQ4M4_26100 [Leptolyngbya sp. AN02str]|uniref:hypothetical protein n=1 Tax=Leptolyngbya sp. AN02str TaxID=3423363 RepID=UPI003D31240D
MTADSTNNDIKQPFEQFVRQSPTLSESKEPKIVTLVGTVIRSAKEGMFMLLIQDSEVIELPLEAVKQYQILEERSGQPLVQIEVSASQTAPFILATPHRAEQSELEILHSENFRTSTLKDFMYELP